MGLGGGFSWGLEGAAFECSAGGGDECSSIMDSCISMRLVEDLLFCWSAQ